MEFPGDISLYEITVMQDYVIVGNSQMYVTL